MTKAKVLVSGCNGQMGQILCRVINESKNFEVLYGFDQTARELSDFFVFTDLENFDLDEGIRPDIVIDFSAPEGTFKALNFAKRTGIPIVIATTALGEFGNQEILKASKVIPVFQSANMSYEVCLFKKILQMIAPKLKGVDIEIEERHHNRKKDAPSGTAKSLADAINESLGNEMQIIYGRDGKREENEIGIASLRGGDIVGEHSVCFIGKNEEFKLTHIAYSREMFAEGALKAAEYLLSVNSPGLYTMDDLL